MPGCVSRLVARPIARRKAGRERIERGLHRFTALQFAGAVSHRHGQGLQRAQALAHDAKRADVFSARHGQRGRRRKEPLEDRERRGQRLAEAFHQPPRDRARRGHRERLAEDHPGRGLEVVHAAGHAHAGARGAGQGGHLRVDRSRVDQSRVGLQVEALAGLLQQPPGTGTRLGATVNSTA
jgi:hypothetical protein